jgi:hypothetical protein
VELADTPLETIPQRQGKFSIFLSAGKVQVALTHSMIFSTVDSTAAEKGLTQTSQQLEDLAVVEELTFE